MLLIVFMLCSSPQFAFVISNGNISTAARGGDTHQFILDHASNPIRIIKLEEAMTGFNCV